MTIDQNPKLLALKEMGLLEIGTGLSARGSRTTEHRLSTHAPLWDYCKPSLAKALGKNGRTLFASLPRDTPPADITAQSKLGIFIGASNSSQLKHYLDQPDCIALIFEPDLEALSRFCKSIMTASLVSGGAFLFGGDFETLDHPLSHLLPKKMFDLGFPVFHIQDGIGEQFPDYVRQLIEQIEFFYYRFNIYPVRSALYSRSRPIRAITTHLFYDQQKHFYENIPSYLKGININHLEDSFKGATALVVLAGPGLEEKIDFIKRERKNCLLICVNSVLAPLLENGIQPDFALISDNTFDSSKTLAKLTDPVRTCLVGHCLSRLDHPIFPKHVIYGSWKEELFGERADLLTHGSVITTAYALALHLGCARTILVGAILAGTSPARPLAYAKGTLQAGTSEAPEESALSNKYPQLYPASNSRGETMYTTLNFRDVVLWLRDEIRTHDMAVINTNADSILWGPGIEVDEAIATERDFPVQEALQKIMSLQPDPVDRMAAIQYISDELVFWKKVLVKAAASSEAAKAGDLNPAIASLKEFDDDNVTYLTHRFEDFSNMKFHQWVFEGTKPKHQRHGLLYYLDHVRRMASEFIRTLENSLNKIETS